MRGGATQLSGGGVFWAERTAGAKGLWLKWDWNIPGTGRRPKLAKGRKEADEVRNVLGVGEGMEQSLEGTVRTAFYLNCERSQGRFSAREPLVSML